MNPDDVQASVAKASSEVAEGQRLFGEGRLVEALATAASVLVSDPDNVPALALKGDCLERSGDVEGALEAYEHVVTLKPDSPLDRIRVAQLRRLAVAPQPFVEERPERRSSILAGAAAFLLMTSAGSAVYLAGKKEVVVNDPPKVETATKSVPFTAPTPVPTQSGQAKQNTEPPADSAGTQPTDGGNAADDQRRGNGSAYSGIGPRRPGPSIGLKLEPGQPNTSRPEDFRPVDPNYVLTKEPDPKAVAGTSDPDPTPVKAQDDSQKPEANGQKAIIDIHPSGPTNKTEGGSQSKDGNVNEGTSLIRVARQYFLAGEYDKAAKAYERAIKLGASTASANHRLAQCYVNLRRRPEALAAYQRALSAYQRMLNEGIGDKRLVESYMEECRQAIKLLQ